MFWKTIKNFGAACSMTIGLAFIIHLCVALVQSPKSSLLFFTESSFWEFMRKGVTLISSWNIITCVVAFMVFVVIQTKDPFNNKEFTKQNPTLATFTIALHIFGSFICVTGCLAGGIGYMVGKAEKLLSLM